MDILGRSKRGNKARYPTLGVTSWYVVAGQRMTDHYNIVRSVVFDHDKDWDAVFLVV